MATAGSIRKRARRMLCQRRNSAVLSVFRVFFSTIYRFKMTNYRHKVDLPSKLLIYRLKIMIYRLKIRSDTASDGPGVSKPIINTSSARIP